MIINEKTMNILYLIPARANSKGIPDKNIKRLGPFPLLAHSIHQAKLAGASPEDIVLSTDSEKYAEIGREHGANVPFLRPCELATDTSGSREVMLHAVDTLNAAGREYDTICLLQPTSPFRDPEDIEKAISLFRKYRPDMVVGVKISGANPYYNLFERDEKGFLHISKGDGRITRRQDAPEVLEFNGAIYIIDVKALRKEPISRFARIIPYLMPTERSIDIDTPSDWEKAEKIFSERNRG